VHPDNLIHPDLRGISSPEFRSSVVERVGGPPCRGLRPPRPPRTQGVAMMARRRLFLSVFLFVGGFPHAGSAQTIRGIVREQPSGTPIRGAEVHVLDTADAVVSVSSSDDGGVFLATVSEAGTYWLRVTAMGYDSASTEFFALAPNENLSLEFLLPLKPIPLNSLDVVADPRPRWLELKGFYRRKRAGYGYFIEREEIDQSSAVRLTDLLYGIPGVRVYWNSREGDTSVLLRGKHPRVVLDGMVLRDTDEINALVHPYDIEAIEVYPGIGGVPVQYRDYNGGFGTIVIWTRR